MGAGEKKLIVDLRRAELERNVEAVGKQIQQGLSGSFRFVLIVFDESDPDRMGVGLSSAPKAATARALNHYLEKIGGR